MSVKVPLKDNAGEVEFELVDGMSKDEAIKELCIDLVSEMEENAGHIVHNRKIVQQNIALMIMLFLMSCYAFRDTLIEILWK